MYCLLKAVAFSRTNLRLSSSMYIYACIGVYITSQSQYWNVSYCYYYLHIIIRRPAKRQYNTHSDLPCRSSLRDSPLTSHLSFFHRLLPPLTTYTVPTKSPAISNWITVFLNLVYGRKCCLSSPSSPTPHRPSPAPYYPDLITTMRFTV